MLAGDCHADCHRGLGLQCPSAREVRTVLQAPPTSAVASGVVHLNLGGAYARGLRDVGRGTLGLAKWLAMTTLFHGALLAGLLRAWTPHGAPSHRILPADPSKRGREWGRSCSSVTCLPGWCGDRRGESLRGSSRPPTGAGAWLRTDASGVGRPDLAGVAPSRRGPSSHRADGRSRLGRSDADWVATHLQAFP